MHTVGNFTTDKQQKAGVAYDQCGEKRNYQLNISEVYGAHYKIGNSFILHCHNYKPLSLLIRWKIYHNK